MLPFVESLTRSVEECQPKDETTVRTSARVVGGSNGPRTEYQIVKRSKLLPALPASTAFTSADEVQFRSTDLEPTTPAIV
jgi:hypothetical protein